MNTVLIKVGGKENFPDKKNSRRKGLNYGRALEKQPRQWLVSHFVLKQRKEMVTQNGYSKAISNLG